MQGRAAIMAVVVMCCTSLAGGCRDASSLSGPPTTLSPIARLDVSGTTPSGWTAIDLGTLGGESSEAVAVNGSGAIAGNSYTADDQLHAFLWTAGGGMQDLGTLGGDRSTAEAINSSGDIAGTSRTASGDLHAFLWHRSTGTMEDLGTPGGSYSIATDMNDADQVVGYGASVAGGQVPFSWSSGTLTPLASQGRAWAVNSQGVATGEVSTAYYGFRAYTWFGDVATDLQSEFGSCSPSGYCNSQGYAINGSDHVAGCCVYTPSSPSPVWSAYFWDGNGVVAITPGCTGQGAQVVPPLFGTAYRVPFDINDGDQVVGGMACSAGSEHGFFWENGVLTTVPTLGGDFSSLVAVNGLGHAVGVSSYALVSFYHPQHAIYWSDGSLTDLGTLGGSESQAAAINDNDEVVGWANPPGASWVTLGTANVAHATLWRRLTPSASLDDLIDDVGQLQTNGALNYGQAYSLVNKLNMAKALVEDGKTSIAIHHLDAFVHEVESLIADGVLTQAEGQPLISSTQALIDQLGG